MRLKAILTAILLSFSITGVASAKSTCSATKYKLLDDTVKFGDTLATLKSKVKRSFGRNATVVEPQDGLVVVVFKKPYKNLDKIIYLTKDKQVIRVLFRYSAKMVSKFGSRVDFFVSLFKKLKTAYGEHSNVEQDKVKDRATIFWPRHEGATMQAMGDNEDVSLRVDCDALEEEINKKMSESTNFGF